MELEATASAVQRRVQKAQKALAKALASRDFIIAMLIEQHGWSHAQAGAFFGISRQRVDQIVADPSEDLEACDTLKESDVSSASGGTQRGSA